jgi:hypothetical protein
MQQGFFCNPRQTSGLSKRQRSSARGSSSGANPSESVLGPEIHEEDEVEGMKSGVMCVANVLEMILFTAFLFGLTYLALRSLDKDLVFELRQKSRYEHVPTH